MRRSRILPSCFDIACREGEWDERISSLCKCNCFSHLMVNIRQAACRTAEARAQQSKPTPTAERPQDSDSSWAAQCSEALVLIWEVDLLLSFHPSSQLLFVPFSKTDVLVMFRLKDLLLKRSWKPTDTVSPAYRFNRNKHQTKMHHYHVSMLVFLAIIL